MPIIVFKENEIEFDDNGYLVDFSKWSRELAVKMAWEGGFKNLGEDKRHWTVLEFLRNLYQKDMLPHNDGELIYLLTKGSGLSLGKLHRIFEGLSIPRLVKWAGLPALSCPAGA
jgi:tRNA 2-thiouridine synthesizing protein E